jgi:peroxiredoxin
MTKYVQKHVPLAAVARSLWSHTAVLTSLLVCSVILNVLLAQQGRSLKKELAAARAARELKLGSALPPLDVLNMEGQPTNVAYGDTQLPTVVYVFSPDCHWCARNADNIKYLASNAQQRYRFVGVSLSAEDLNRYVSENKPPFQVYSSPSEATRAAYKMGGTPQTMVISPEGKLVRNWIGAYSRSVQSDVESFFEMQLPGLAPEPQK